MKPFSRLTAKRKAVAGYTAIPPSASGGGSALQWRQQMFAYAKSQYPTLTADYMIDIDRGSGGDYTTASMLAGSGSVVIDNGFRGGVAQLDTVTTISSQAAITGTGAPVIVPNLATNTPWFVATRGLVINAIDSGSQIFIASPTTAPTGYQFNNPYLGCLGTVSTTNYVFFVSASTKIDTGVAIDTTNFKDFGVGFDGVTLTPYIGNVAASTFAPIAGKSSTDTSGINAGAGTPGALVFISNTTRIKLDVDKLYMAYVVP